MPAVDLLPQRLRNHQLSRSHFHTPERIVAWLGAVQAQDYSAARRYSEFLAMRVEVQEV
jgi:hypothetical protein